MLESVTIVKFPTTILIFEVKLFTSSGVNPELSVSNIVTLALTTVTFSPN